MTREDISRVCFALFKRFFFYAIKNQRKARNVTSRGFGCLELIIYGIRELA